MNTAILYYESPIGTICIEHTEGTIHALYFQAEKPLTKRLPNEFESKVTQQLDRYFEGSLTSFQLSLAPAGTDFQQKVWNQLLQIPFGKTYSYKEMSIQLGDPKLIRAAATANGKNPILLLIPCHRVIGTNGDLIGYAGELWRKQWLLDHENKFANGVQTLF